MFNLCLTLFVTEICNSTISVTNIHNTLNISICLIINIMLNRICKIKPT